MPRRALAAVVMLAASLLVAGCASEPEPEWTEEEAFAEAERVYREFHEASMERYTGSGDDGYLALLTPDMRALEEDGLAWLRESGTEVSGDTVVQSFTPVTFDLVGEAVAVEAEVCVDDTALRFAAPGEDPRQPREDPNYGVTVTFASMDGELKLAEMNEDGDYSC